MKKINTFVAFTFLKAHGVSSFSPSSSLTSNTRFNTIGFTKSLNRAQIINVPTFTNSESALNAARRPLLSEDDLAAPPSEKVIEAVNRLGGNDKLQEQIIEEKKKKEIKESWRDGIENFKSIRSKYLIYN